MIYKKKHQVQTVNELISIQEALTSQVGRITSLEGEIQQVAKSIELQEKQLFDLTKMISANREKAIPEFNDKALSILKQLGYSTCCISN